MIYSLEKRGEGYEFAGEASDGELALPLILEEKPDIVILVMPKKPLKLE